MKRRSVDLISVEGLIGPVIPKSENIKAITGAIFEHYDKENRGMLNTSQISQMMRDMYKSMNIDFQPTKRDIDMFTKMIDPEKPVALSERHFENSVRKHLIPEIVAFETNTDQFSRMDSFQSFDSIKPEENDNIRVAFHEFDTDKDGLLSCFEFERSLIRYGWKLGVNPIKLDIEKVFKEADLDGDDLINYTEYTEIIHNIN